MPDRTPQEDLLIVEALVEFQYREQEARPERADRAWQLATAIAASHGLEVEDALAQRDAV